MNAIVSYVWACRFDVIVKHLSEFSAGDKTQSGGGPGRGQ